MTATNVNGLAVIASEPAPTNIVDKAGNRVYFQQIRALLLEDESIVYGCAHCDYTAASPMQVRPHLNAHRDRKRPATAADEPVKTAPAPLTVSQMLTQVAGDRDRWRERAEAAESALAEVRAIVAAKPTRRAANKGAS
ncbi:hypothetical protein [Streptomyces sp. URMC 129]|uniref:hypothetical protein n=1 Tax=Streptomyces sp. URMC 129 TaxID=3423407 RepID=UPI003F1A5658